MTLETGKPIAKIFLYNFPFQKDLLHLFSSELIQIFPFNETIPLFPFDHSKIRRMRPPQEVQDIGQPRPLQNEEDFTIHYDNGRLQQLKTPKTRRIGGYEEFPDLYDLVRLP